MPRVLSTSKAAVAARAYRQTPEGRASNLRAVTKWAKANPLDVLLVTVRARAKKMGLPFNLTREDIVVPALCPILGIPLILHGGRMCPNSASVDRIIPELGYTPSNTRVISWQANKLKSNMSVSTITNLYHYVKGVL